MNRARHILERISVHIPYEGQRGETDVPSNLRLTPGSSAGYTADYHNPAYAYGGGWWQATGEVDIDNIPAGLVPFIGDPDDLQHETPTWNKPGVGNILPDEYTLRGSRGFVTSTAVRGDGSLAGPTDYNPTGKHTRPSRLAE